MEFLCLLTKCDALLLEEGGYPEYHHGADHGGDELAYDARGLNAYGFKQQAAHEAAHYAQNQVYEAAETAAFHNLTGSKSCQYAYDD